MKFVHLKTQSEYSITQGLNRLDDIIDKAKENKMGALALTDVNGMFGSINFYKDARKAGIKPIVGVDFTVEQDDGNTYQLAVLAKNEAGYKSLIELNSRAYTENRKESSAPIKEEWLADLQNVIVLSGAKQGLIGQLILQDKLEEAKEVASQMKDFFGDDFYMELQRDASPEEEKYMDGAVSISQDLQIAPVATHPVMFLQSDDFVAHETRYCIGNKETLFNIKRKRPFNKDMYFKTQEEMEELFSDIPVALENTINIAKKCNIQLHLDEPKLPMFPTPNGINSDDYFAQQAKDGLEERLMEDFPNEEEREQVRKRYEDRLETEIKIIQKMGFPGYFLIVADFIGWAKKNDIPVGTGRGSGAGSLVAYSMKITDIDPLPYNLLFERFLNPDRVSMPDFDIDFCQSRRGEVYEYVREKYGVNAVSQIGTFGTMAAKAVIRDVGRAFDFNHDFMDTLAKMVVIKPNKPVTLKQFIFGDEEKGIEGDEKLLARYNNEADVKKLIDIALRLEGLTKQVGTHAAGVVISPTKVTDFSPLYTLEPGGSPSTQFAKEEVEIAGLVKFDFLGLRNLTIIKETVDLINERNQKNGDEFFNIRKINTDDQAVYQNIFSSGNTVGIFQFEGKGMTGVIQKANPNKLGDLIAINALYRPGPMEIIPEWLASKSLPEDKRPYPHPKLKEILKETYGFMIYQEQVMQCAQVIAGYSLGEADLLRRAMGKKKPEEMKKQREVFIKGAAKNNVDENTAIELFDLIEKFSGYGFNKSHAAAYSYIGFQTAYLKNYYPEEFLTANLNSNTIGALDTDKIAILVNDAEKNNIEILPPNINASNFTFNIEENGKIRYGLGAVKGVGEKAAFSIQRDREEKGPYVDFFDFLERVGKGNVNKKVLEALVKAGAFDTMEPNRALLFENIELSLDYVTKFRKNQMTNVSVLGDSLFDDAPAPVVVQEQLGLDGEVVTDEKPKKKGLRKNKVKVVKELVRPEFLQPKEDWNELALLKNEKSVFGYFFTDNPYQTYYARELDGFKVATPLAEIKNEFDYGNTEVFVGAVIEEINWWKSKKGAFVKISDGTSTTEMRMFADFLNDNKDWLKPDSFISMKMKIQPDDNENGYSLSLIQGFSFDQTKQLTLNKIFVGNNEADTQDNVDKFLDVCKKYENRDSENSVILCVPATNTSKTKKVMEINVKVENALFDELKGAFGNDWVKATFKKDIDKVVFPDVNNKKKNKGNYSKPKRSSFSN